MVPRKFEYFAPKSVGEATALLKKYGSDARVLAGGMSLIPIMKLRLSSPAYLIDINGIPGLEHIKEEGGNLLVGARTRHHDFERSKLIREKAYIMSECAGTIADPQVRNMGTIGGALCHSDPSGDWGSVVLALRGSVKIAGPSKERTMTIDDFLVDMFTSALKPNEILTEIIIPVPPARSGGAYLKLQRKTGDTATAAVAAQLTLDSSGTCAHAGIGLTSLGSKNLRAVKAERMLLGKSPTPSVIDEAAEAASEDSQPTADPLRGSAEYKREMAKVFTRRAVQLAVARANGGKR